MFELWWIPWQWASMHTTNGYLRYNNMNDSIKEAIMIMCPPLSDYPEYPKDQSHSELFDCPKCKEKMWLSDKMKGMLMSSACINKHIILACYKCIKDMVINDPSILDVHERIDIWNFYIL